MKKHLAYVLALFMAAAVALTLAGCGNDASRARECVEGGDGVLAEAAVIGDELTGKVESLLSGLGAELSRGEKPDAEKFKEGMEGVHWLFDELDMKYDEAKSSYGKVEGLKGVDDYKEYARTRMAQIIISEEMLEDIRSHLDKLERDISSSRFDAAALAEEASVLGERVERKAEEVTDLMNRAEKIKVQKGSGTKTSISTIRQ